jgi:hypothetical protein
VRLQDDIFQDVFENVGLFYGDSHCNEGDTKEECLDPPNQAKSNHQNSSDWKEPENSKFCEGFCSCSSGLFVSALAASSPHLFLNVLQLGQCLEPTNDPEEKTTLIGLIVLSRHLFKNALFSS